MKRLVFSALSILGMVLFLGCPTPETGPTVPKNPGLSPGQTYFIQGDTVSIVSSGATAIYYTTDGTDPTTASTQFTTPIALSTAGAKTIKALAVNAQGSSAISTFNLTVLTEPVTLYYKPASGTPTLWYWELNGRAFSELEGYTWATQPQLTAATKPSWYKYSIPTKFYPFNASVHMKFSQGAEIALDTPNMGQNWYYDGVWYNTDPDLAAPKISADKGSTSVSTPLSVGYISGLQILVTPTVVSTVSISSRTWSTYINGTPARSGSFTAGGTVDLTADFVSATDGQTIELRLAATNTNGTTTEKFYYSKTSSAAPEDVDFTDPTDPLLPMGYHYMSTSKTYFRVWAPGATTVQVKVGATTYGMTKLDPFGVYSDVYQYQYTSDALNQEYQFLINGAAIRDPYGKMIKSGTPNTYIVLDTDNILPTAGSWAARPTLSSRTDAVIYELHVRDYSINDTNVPAANRGKFSGLTAGLGTSGLDHIVDLGVTHVQLLPTYDFATGDFANGSYNWGYDPQNYNIPEEQYSNSPTASDATRIREYQDMVRRFQAAGLRVVLDVVYNHTYQTNTLPSFYYDTNDLAGLGLNALDAKKPMVSRMIRDSLEYWVKQYNVDGFRFDLMGAFPYLEMQNWSKYLGTKYSGRTLLMYGEPWIGGSDTYANTKVRLGKMPAIAKDTGAHLGAFNDRIRYAVKGDSDSSGGGYMFGLGDWGWFGAIPAAVKGSIQAVEGNTNALADDWDSLFAYAPEQSINYMAAHDNLCLWDKVDYTSLKGNNGGAFTWTTALKKNMNTFAMGIVLTSQGIPFIHAGDEFLRTKGNGNIVTNLNIAKNTYNASDVYNQINWGLRTTNADVLNVYKALITLRKTYPAFRLNTWADVNNRVKPTINAGTNSMTGANFEHDAGLPLFTVGTKKMSVTVTYLDNDNNTGNGYELAVVYNPSNSTAVTAVASGPGANQFAFSKTGPLASKKIFDSTGAAGVPASATDGVCAPASVTVFSK